MSAPRRRPNQPPSASGERKVQVGDRHDGGEVSASVKDLDGRARLVVNAFQMLGQTVDVSLDDAAELRDGLTAMLEESGYE